MSVERYIAEAFESAGLAVMPHCQSCGEYDWEVEADSHFVQLFVQELAQRGCEVVHSDRKLK